MPDYIRWIRGLVGHQTIILNFAGCVVADEHGGVLLQQRGDRDANVWGFPGGAVELGETVADAAMRECREETGLNVSLVSLLGVYSAGLDRYPNGDSAQPITTFFVAEARSGTLACDGEETRALAYFTKDELPTLVNGQHARVARDYFAGRQGCWDSN
jgi:ADP-ribose pyrophosphatase YjhB (NUDIX family)